MPPGKEIWDEHARIWGQAKPAVVDSPQPKDRNRTRKIILRTATIRSTITAVLISITVITAFIVINSSSNQPNDRPTLNVNQSRLNTISDYQPYANLRRYQCLMKQ